MSKERGPDRSDGRESEFSQIYTVTVLEPGEPLEPSGIIRGRRPRFRWTGGLDDLVYEIRLFRRDTDRPVYMPVWLDFDTTATEAVPVTELEPGDYRWWVFAHNRNPVNFIAFVTHAGYFIVTE